MYSSRESNEIQLGVRKSRHTPKMVAKDEETTKLSILHLSRNHSMNILSEVVAVALYK